MRKDMIWNIVVAMVGVIILGVFVGMLAKSFIARKAAKQAASIQTKYYSKGGIELELAPDYRLSGPELQKLGEVIVTKLKSDKIAAPGFEVNGATNNGRYEGLKLTFPSNAAAGQAQNTGAIPASYQLETYGEIKNLTIASRINGNIIELTVVQDCRDFSADILQRAVTIINSRINDASAGLSDAGVIRDRNDRIRIQLPAYEATEEAQAFLTAAGRLTFRIDGRIVLDGTDLENVKVINKPETAYNISFGFRGNGAKLLARVTTENINKKMAVYIDDSLLMEPVIRAPITSGQGMITFGNKAKEEVARIAVLIKSGALPVPLRIIQSTRVGPPLQNRKKHIENIFRKFKVSNGRNCWRNYWILRIPDRIKIVINPGLQMTDSHNEAGILY